jgi:glycosyltransferase involved in cell wall biosynthesis
MKEGKVLVLSPVPTHPPRAGSWIRVRNLLRHIKEQGLEIHFVFCSQEWRFSGVVNAAPDIGAMKDCWDAFYRVYNPRDHVLFTIDRFFAQLGGIMRKAFPRSAPFLDRHNRKIQRHTRIANKGLPRADHYYHDGIDRLIMKLLDEHRYDYVLCEYIYFTRCFRLFDGRSLKIVDTLDNLSRRRRLGTETGLQEEAYGFDEKDEHEALSRADVVIAIQETERGDFSGLLGGGVTVRTVGHIVDLHEPCSPRAEGTDMLFVGTRWIANIKSINHFIQTTLPLVRSRLPTARLVIAGNVSGELVNAEGVVTLGEVDDLAEVYSMADVVVSPMLFGTGLKIKSIEALGRSKPVVMSSHAAVGLGEGAGQAFLVADSPEETAGALVRVLKDRDLRSRLSREAHMFARLYNTRQTDAIEQILRLHRGCGDSERDFPVLRTSED